MMTEIREDMIVEVKRAIWKKKIKMNEYFNIYNFNTYLGYLQ